MANLLAVATLALGVGASTAMFSLVHPMLLHPLPYPHADRLAILESRDPRGRAGPISWPEFRDGAGLPLFSDAAAFDIGFFFLTGVDEPEQIAGSLVTPNLLRVLGVAPALGRDFRAGEDDVVILSDACWKRRFGADPHILGRSIALDFARTPETEHYTVIGVMPPGFWMYYRDFEVFVPLPRASMNQNRRARGLMAVARLRDGATIAQARSAVRGIPEDKGWSADLHLWERSESEQIRPGFLLIAAGAVVLLWIATANVTGLLLVRAQARRREIAIRAALGATPARLVRMLTGEALKLWLSSSVIGILLAWWALRLTIASLPRGETVAFLAGLDRVVIDWSALLFAAVVSLLACLLAGIFPAMASCGVDPAWGLKDPAPIGAARTRTILVMAEIALSVALLAGAGLLIKTMDRVETIDLGFRADHLLTLRAPLPRSASRAQAEVYYRELQARLSTLPGVRSAALASAQPLTGAHRREKFEIPDRGEPAEAEYRVVSPEYFATLGIAMDRGRGFETRDERRAVISEALARKYWPQEDPVGKFIRVEGESVEIVGVCADTRDVLLRDPVPVLYRNWRDAPDRAQQIDIRTADDPLALAHAVNGVIRDSGGVLAEIQEGRQFVDDAIWQQKQSAQVLTAFAALALLLAGIGLYGVISLAIAGRTREIGIRLAIGAKRADVVALVLREIRIPLIAGLTLGLALAYATGRFVRSLLYQVAPSDPWVMISVAGVVILAAAIASAAPLRRALRVDPLIALRAD